MGGLGSGRPSGSGRDKVEACRAIDVNHLRKTGCLRPGWSGSWQWTRDGERVAWISMRSDPDRLHLSYRGNDREAVHFGHRGAPPRLRAVERFAAL